MAHEDGPFIFRINENGSGPNLLVQVCSERGWREYNENTPLRDNWNLWWRTNGFPSSTYKSLKMWQFTNHIPKASSICRKDTLARSLRCMRKVYGSVYDFSPSVYNLPLEYNKLVAECSKNRTTIPEEEDVWICKPVGLSQGRGIYLFRRLSDLTYDTNTIVQRYIRNPLLIGGYKCDLRLYVCVTSYRPLAIYLYREGIVRFSTDKFSLNDLDNPFCHLTNCSLNKMGPGYFEKKDRIGSGCKWTLKQLRHYFTQSGMEDWLLWQRVVAIVVLTVLTQVPFIPNSPNCFEFLGFDILVDSSLRPWLLEVNLSPALGNDCDVDPAVKKPMLHDLFDLLGLPVRNTGLSLFTIWDNGSMPKQATLTQRASGNSLIGSWHGPEGAAGEAGAAAAAACTMGSTPTLAVVTAAQHWRRHHQKQQRRAARSRQISEGEDDATQDEEASKGRSGRQSPAVRGASCGAAAVAGPAVGGRRGVGRARRGMRRGLSASTASPVPSMPLVVHPAPPAADVTARTSSPQQHRSTRVGPRHPTPSPPPVAHANPALRVTSLRLCSQRGGDAPSRANASASPGEARTRSASRGSPSESHWGRSQESPLLMDRYRSTRSMSLRARLAQPQLWGNGKDWRSPCAREGDWVRIFPMSDPPPPSEAGGGGSACGAAAGAASAAMVGGCLTGSGAFAPGACASTGGGEGPTNGAVGDPEVRRAVAEVNRMLRVAREVARKYNHCSDNDRSNALSDHMAFNGEVWLPRK